VTCTPDTEVDYRQAFDEFTRIANRVQSLAAQNITGTVFEAALLELEQAHMAYNEARDSFLRSLLPNAALLPDARKPDFAGDVPGIAELIWESEGRPQGTADEDWRRAETIVRRALATGRYH
jgi:Protein of unknown function (DUF2934)